MAKGEMTRQAILKRALALASEVGLEGLSLGRLASDLGISKSTLLSHVLSKEGLQHQVLDFAAGQFIENVLRPSFLAAPGEGRIRALFENWLDGPESEPFPGGCFFIAAATELDDRPGTVRDRLVELQRKWMGVLAETVRGAATTGEFPPGVDAEQFAHDVYGVMLAYHHASRLLRDPAARSRARTAFEALLTAARRPAAPRRGEADLASRNDPPGGPPEPQDVLHFAGKEGVPCRAS
jgi:AcrR family transcriptional regulator